MNEEHSCSYEERWGKVLNHLENISSKVCKHIEEGEKEGGFRDRLLLIEQEVSTLKKSYWKTCAVAGLIGGLLGKISPDMFNFFVKMVSAGQ